MKREGVRGEAARGEVRWAAVRLRGRSGTVRRRRRRALRRISAGSVALSSVRVRALMAEWTAKFRASSSIVERISVVRESIEQR